MYFVSLDVFLNFVLGTVKLLGKFCSLGLALGLVRLYQGSICSQTNPSMCPAHYPTECEGPLVGTGPALLPCLLREGSVPGIETFPHVPES